MQAQVAITTAFGQQAPKAVASYAGSKANELKAQANAAQQAGDTDQAQALTAEATKWEEGGSYRVAMHTALGAFSGGAAGALGAGTVASAAPLLDALQSSIQSSLINAGMNAQVAQAASQLVAQGTAAGVGAAVGGTQGAALAFNVDANNRIQHISRPLDIKYIGGLADHRSTVIERDRPDQFPDDIRDALGEPIQLPSGKYGYAVEDLKSTDGKLYPVANGLPNLTEKTSSVMGTLNALSSGNVTIYRIDADNYPVEDQLLRNYARGIKLGATVPYPSLAETLGCYLNFCSNFTNSNTQADNRLKQTGILPPNTGTSNVPGGNYDSDVTPWDAALNALTDNLNKMMRNTGK